MSVQQPPSIDLVRELIHHVKAEGLTEGDRLPSIRALAEKFGVTPSAVRDAQIRLQAMGLIRIQPRSGAVVQSVNLAPLVDALSETLDNSLLQSDPSLFHLLDARQLIEVECATIAARRRTLEDLLPLREALAETIATAEKLNENSTKGERVAHYEADIRFHLLIAELAGNPVLTSMLRSVLGLLKPHLVEIPWEEKRVKVTIDAHLELFEALR